MPKKKSKEITQEDMRLARISGKYDEIWKSRDKCVFCDLKDKYVVLEENGVALTVSLYPYIDGHMMAIPTRHVRSAKELNENEWEQIRKLSYVAKKLIRKEHKHKGMWTLVREGQNAQGTVGDHLHIHFIPFDNEDLCQWNYRELAHTPIENANRYKSHAGEISRLNKGFYEKYKPGMQLPVVVDALILNTEGQLLVEERQSANAFTNGYYSLIGGHVDDASLGLKMELKREIIEETGLELDTEQAKIVYSDIGEIEYTNPSAHLGIDLPFSKRFLWNVYLIEGVDSSSLLEAGSDASDLHWFSIKNALETD
ncbi:MAG: HIT domain-containing protein, partial [Candidatus Dojkabacteria bacterium]